MLLHDRDTNELEIADDLVLRRTTSYSILASESSASVAVNQAIACALKSRPKAFHYAQKHLRSLPPSIGHLSACKTLRELDLFGNELHSLPDEIEKLTFIEICNLGNNHFGNIPNVLAAWTRLRKLLLFQNQLGDLSSCVTLSALTNLRILNLNHNAITQLPPTIAALVHLEVLTLDHNQLRELPQAIGSCTNLVELRLGYNQLRKLPLELGCLLKLKHLIVHRNRLVDLPESLINLHATLEVLDIAGNEIRICPNKFHTLRLREFYAERNPFIERVPVRSTHDNEVLTLKELCARYAMNGCDPTTLRQRVQQSDRAKEILMQCSQCRLCQKFFLNTWLECVEFIDIQRTFKRMTKTHHASVPQRALLCSYECFTSHGHPFFGVAFG